MSILADDAFYHYSPYTYEDRMGGLLQAILDSTGIVLPDQPFILDAGCSSGCSTVDIAKFFPLATVLGVDLNPELAIERYGYKISKLLDNSSEQVLERVMFARGDMFKLNDIIPQADLILMANNILFKLTEYWIAYQDPDIIEETICKHLISSAQKLKVHGYLILALALPGNFKPKYIVFQKDSLTQISLVHENLLQGNGPLCEQSLKKVALSISRKLSEA